jgi:hypothetical protein
MLWKLVKIGEEILVYRLDVAALGSEGFDVINDVFGGRS